MNKDIIRVCQPDPELQVFVLGGMSWRVSLHTQQRRAVDLVDAVKDELPVGSPVAVIGGGAAGVMSSAALLLAGHQVTLYERAGSLLSLQRKSKTRFIHPNSVTWPYSALPCTTDLPFLNWHAAYSHEIADIIEREFRNDFGAGREDGVGISVRTDTNVISINKVDGSIALTSERVDVPNPDTEQYAAAFIATGFNRERKISGYDNFSYWEDTSPVPIGSQFEKPNVAVIGDGDGALVELVRCIWGRENLDELYRFVVEKFIRNGPVVERIIKAEEGARKTYQTNPAGACATLSDAYRGGLLSPNGKNFLRIRADKTAKLSIISRYAHPFSPKASPIHKVLLGFLLDEKIVVAENLEASTVIYDNDRYFVDGTQSDSTPARRGPFQRVLERLGPERKFCPLVQSTFGGKLDQFIQENGIEYDFANPNSTSKYSPERQIAGPLSESTPIEIAVDKLRQYFRTNYDKQVMDVSIGIIDEGTNELGFRVNLNTETVKQNGPKRYLGYGIRYDKAKAPPRALAGSESECVPMSDHSLGGDTRHRAADTEEVLCAGRAIFNLTNADRRRRGRIAAFVTPRLPSSPHQEPEIFCLTAAHAIGANPNAKVGIQVSASRQVTPADGDGIAAPQPNPKPFRVIGRIDTSRFAEPLGLWRTDSAYNCLKDVCIVRIEPGVRVRNLSGATLISVAISSAQHFLRGNGRVHVRGLYFGQISRIRSEPIIVDPEGNRIRTSGFFVSRHNVKIEITPGSSGRPVFTDDGQLLGMIIASADNELFCVDISEVLDRLDCELLPDTVIGAIEKQSI